MSLSAEITREILQVGLVLLVFVFNFLTIPCLMLWLHSNLEIKIHRLSIESEASRRRHFIRLHERLTLLGNSQRVFHRSAANASAARSNTKPVSTGNR